MSIAQLSQNHHRNICTQILATPSGIPNIADKGSEASKQIAKSLVRRLDCPLASQAPAGQRAGTLFEQFTSEFLKDSLLTLGTP